MLMEKIKGKEFSGLIIILTIFVMVGYGEGQSKGFLVNCGSNSTVKAAGRTWVGDLAPHNNLTLNPPGVAVTTSTLPSDSIFSELYKSARVFDDKLNYTFKRVNGSYFVRLHFCPFLSDNYNFNESSFDVLANGLRLVTQFEVTGNIAHKNLELQSSGKPTFFLIKEYILPISPGDLLLEFVPAKGSFGFVNAIEIVPVLDKLFSDSVARVGSSDNAHLNGRGIETMYRLNVGGPEIGPDEDPVFYRTWKVDTSYMVTANAGSEIKNSSNITYASTNNSSVAPLAVYEAGRAMSNTEVLEKRFNMSWKFEVDPDFDYLIRLHFCELLYDKVNQRIFRIYINNRTAASSFDIYNHAGGRNKATYQDYSDPLASNNNVLWIQLGSDAGVTAFATDALLNGLEIFKLSRNRNLAYLERFDSNGHSVHDSKVPVLWIGVGTGLGTIVVLAVTAILVICFCRKKRKESGDIKNKNPNWRPLFLNGSVLYSTVNSKRGTQNTSLMTMTVAGQKFTLSAIRAATNNFDEALVIGVGGFGKVYKGEIQDGTLAAIKRANPHSEQGLAEFETEIEMLSKLRHRHLVSLIGFCEEQNEMILVYEYMANGTLRSHLFGSNLPPLTWKQRLEACIGAARGLHYLHTGSERGIIHRDVKTTNILLDENFVAKMADFGLSKNGPNLDYTHVSTAVKGSFGYLDPEYFRRQQLTEKSDVYSLGVVLFEVVCARAVINPSLPKDQINLAEWAMRWQKQRSLEIIIDPYLKGNYSPESMEKFGEIAEKCLADEGKNRPTMGEVLWHLECVLQIHEAWLRAKGGDKSSSSSEALLVSGERGEERAEDASGSMDKEGEEAFKI